MDFSGAFEYIGKHIAELLPTSPFRQFLDEFSNLPYLGYLNWLIPVKAITIVMAAWLASITVFYLYSIVMRWLKVIGD